MPTFNESVVVADANGNPILILEPSNGSLTLKNGAGDVIQTLSNRGSIQVEGKADPALFTLNDDAQRPEIVMAAGSSGAPSMIRVGGHDHYGALTINGKGNKSRIELDAEGRGAADLRLSNSGDHVTVKLNAGQDGGNLSLLDKGGKISVAVNAASGSNGARLVLNDSKGQQAVGISGEDPSAGSLITLRNLVQNETVYLCGGDTASGSLLVLKDGLNENITLDGTQGIVQLRGGSLVLTDLQKQPLGTLGLGVLHLGAGEASGSVELENGDGVIGVKLSGASQQVIVRSPEDKKNVVISGAEEAVEVIANDEERTVVLNRNGNMILGGKGHDGDLFVTDRAADTTAHLNGEEGALSLGAKEVAGSLEISGGETGNRLQIEADRWLMENKARNKTLEADGENRAIRLFAPSGNLSVLIDGANGDIVLPNADCAEDFKVASVEAAEPGTVMVIGEENSLVPCDSAYDSRVAGVLAGARDIRPGLVLGRKPGQRDHLPITLTGRTNCKVDASFGAIEVGDLLTTSPTTGHAMKAQDPTRMTGTLIGKALQPWREGKGMITILAALQ